MVFYSPISQNTHKMGKISNFNIFEILGHPNKGVTRGLLMCHKGVSWASKDCYKGVSMERHVEVPHKE